MLFRSLEDTVILLRPPPQPSCFAPGSCTRARRCPNARAAGQHGSGTTRKLAIGGRCFCGAPKLPCATANILWRTIWDAPQKDEVFCGAFPSSAPLNWHFLWRTIWDAPQKTCGPHHQRLDGILPHLFCGAWIWMRHKNMCFCGASGNMRHRTMGGPRQKKLREPLL